MGMDVYGLNPRRNTAKPEILIEYMDDEGWTDWEKLGKNNTKDEDVKAGLEVSISNIEKNIIMDLIPLIKVKNSKVILSGILVEQQQEVYIKLVQEGFENIFINKKGEWVCLIADYI